MRRAVSVLHAVQSYQLRGRTKPSRSYYLTSLFFPFLSFFIFLSFELPLARSVPVNLRVGGEAVGVRIRNVSNLRGGYGEHGDTSVSISWMFCAPISRSLAPYH
ncbi:hypothetical protein B0H16DRAFT_1590491 [Mycena metata]|uniref:Uncharacterized protein n=1 Tax=Mycena metata TaxID=1033252 RepID=A0AAD7MPX5_9AGAR|nr:hypothetical protein B0H16DRAFT_1590491 [Mycena metata]